MSTIAGGTEVGLVTLTVRDLPKARHFYAKVLGLALEEHPQDARTLIVSAGDGRALVELRGSRFADPPDPSRPGLFHIALRVQSRHELSTVLMRLAAHGVALTGASDHLVSEALYLRDPEGNGIEIYCDRPEREWPRDEQDSPRLDTLPLDLRGLADELVGAPPSPEEAAHMPAGTRVGHIHLQVSDLQRSERFYAGVLGFSVTSREAKGALFLAAGRYHHHVGLNVWNSAGSRPAADGAAGLHSFELRLPTATDLAEVIERVVAQEIELQHVGERARIRDPSANVIVLTT